MSTITDPTLQREFRQAGLWLGAMWDEKHERHERHRHVSGRRMFGDRASRRTLSRLQHRPCHVRARRFLDRARHRCWRCSTHRRSILTTAGSCSVIRWRWSTCRRIMISRWNFLNDFGHAWVLRFHSRPEFVGLLHEALIAVGPNGQHSRRQRKRDAATGKYQPRLSFVGQPVSNFFKFDFETLEQRASSEPSTIWPVRDLAHGRRFFALVRAPLRSVLARERVAEPTSVTPSRRRAPNPRRLTSAKTR